MKRKQIDNNGKPVTLAQLKEVIAPIYKRFDGIDQRFDGIGQRFDGIDQRFDQIDKSIDVLKVTVKKSEESIEILLTHADGFAKNSEQHGKDIILLTGHQADLERHCAKKIGYVYGDNL